MVVVSVEARAGVPLTTGSALLTGGAETTGPTASEVPEAVPSTLVAVTWTRMLAPVSAGCSV